MPAPKGNRFWEVRSKHGKDKILKTPKIMWEAACEYFQWSEDNPLVEEKIFNYQGEIVIGKINKMRAMTMQGLCIFMDISTSSYYDYKSREGYSAVIKKIDEIIYTQKFSGAAADMLNANIIARDLGLADKKEVKEVTDDLDSMEKISAYLKENGIDVSGIK